MPHSAVDLAKHWLHYCPSWRSFPRVNLSSVEDACRYFTRDGYRSPAQPAEEVMTLLDYCRAAALHARFNATCHVRRHRAGVVLAWLNRRTR